MHESRADARLVDEHGRELRILREPRQHSLDGDAAREPFGADRRAEEDLRHAPTAEPRILATGLAPRLASLEGKRVGILDNSKANAGTLMLAVAERLKDRYGVRDIVKREKGIAGAPSPDILAALTTCDFVLVGSAD